MGLSKSEEQSRTTMSHELVREARALSQTLARGMSRASSVANQRLPGKS